MNKERAFDKECALEKKPCRLSDATRFRQRRGQERGVVFVEGAILSAIVSGRLTLQWPP